MIDVVKMSPESKQLWEIFEKGIARLSPLEQNNLFTNPEFPYDKLIDEYTQIDFHTKMLMSLYVTNDEIINLLSHDSEQRFREALTKNFNINKTQLLNILQTSTTLDITPIIQNKTIPDYYKEYAAKKLLSPKKAVSQWLYEDLDHPLHVIIHHKKRMSQNILDMQYKLLPQYQKLLNVAMFETTCKNTLNRINKETKKYVPHLVNNFLLSLFLELIKKIKTEKEINEYITEYIDNSKYSEILNVLNSTSEDDEVIQQILSLNIDFMDNYVLMNYDHIDPFFLKTLAKKNDPFTRALVASHYNTQSATLDYLLFNSPEPFIRYEILNHPRFNNAEYINDLVCSESFSERCDAALLHNLSLQQMIQLFEEDDCEISSRLLLNETVPNSLKSLWQNW